MSSEAALRGCAPLSVDPLTHGVYGGQRPVRPDPNPNRPPNEVPTRPNRIDHGETGSENPAALPSEPDYQPDGPKNPMPHVWPVEPETR
jgi:hypothetical protein